MHTPDAPDPNAPTGSYPPDATPTASDQRTPSAPPRALDPPADPTPGGSARFVPGEFHRAGGLGRVHRATDTELSRPVAFKDIQPPYADSDAARTRLVFEAEVTGRLEHPGVVPVYGLGRDPVGRPFYAMRFVEGETLRDAVRAFHAAGGSTGADRALALRRLLTRFVSVCQTVAFAHSRGVLHRDLKPDNVMLGPFGETLVVDWGLAKRVRAAAGEAESVAGLGAGPVASVAGTRCGTPGYWSPEQDQGRPDAHDERTDVFGLGAVLYAVLTGRAPNAADGHPHDPPPSPRAVAAWVDLDLDAVVRRALAISPADRFPSAADVATEVERWLADQPIVAQRATVQALAARAAAHPADTTLAEQLARQRANLGLMFSGMGRDAEAVAELGPAADAFGRLAAERRKLRLRADEANCRLVLARVLLALGREAEAAVAHRAASGIYGTLIEARPDEYRANYADIMITYAGLPPAGPGPDVPPAELTLAPLPREEPSAGDPSVPATAAADTTRPASPEPTEDPNRTWPPVATDPNPTAMTEAIAGPRPGGLPPAGHEELGGFKVVRELGRGGMGVVYLAHDLDLDRPVAIKKLHAGLSDHRDHRARLQREARLTAGVAHANVVQVYGTGSATDGPFIVLEHLAGPSLLDRLRDLGPGWAPALLDPFAQVCDGLHHAHTRGVIHRDPKLSNMIVLPTGRAVLFDWGLARRVRGSDAHDWAGTTGLPTDPELTAVGTVLGTPAYMSPEQCRGSAEIGAASDVYILGAGLYQLIAGQTPHTGTVFEIMYKVVEGKIPRLREVRPGVPAVLDAICAKAMALRPEDRYPTAAALGADIRAFLAGQTR